MLALNCFFSWLVLSLLTCSPLEVGGSEAAVPPDGACWGLNPGEVPGQVSAALPGALGLLLWAQSNVWDVCAALGSVWFQIFSCALRDVLVAGMVAWLWFSGAE